MTDKTDKQLLATCFHAISYMQGQMDMLKKEYDPMSDLAWQLLADLQERLESDR